MQTIPTTDEDLKDFPPFSLTKLLQTVFEPQDGDRACILIDLKDPHEITDFAYLKKEEYSVQRHSYEKFYLTLKNGVAVELGLTGVDLFAYKATGGSNLDMPDLCVDISGKEMSLQNDVYPKYDLILCTTDWSATAPLTAHAKQYGFRGATLHGLNDIILKSGLAVDYRKVSAEAEKLRLGVTLSDWAEIDFLIDGESYTLHLGLGQQEAQKSHGLCLGREPDVANLPAGEVYFIPEKSHGVFPMVYDDGTIGLMRVEDNAVQSVELLEGDQTVIDEHNAKLIRDPMTGVLGELGLGTQVLPVSGRDIQDEKIRGTVHVATGRDDHLGGHLTPDLFKEAVNASHDDILFAPHKTPKVLVKEVRFRRNGDTFAIIQDYEPTAYWLNCLKSQQ